MTTELKQFSFQSETQGPHLLITAGVHGDEFESIAAVRQLLDRFRSGHSSVTGFTGRVTFVPVVNEGAFLRGHRCAEDGKDLARTCPGRIDGSITEQTAYSLSTLIRSADYYIDLHTGGTELSVFPLAGYMMHANPRVLAAQKRMARAFNLPVIWGTAANLDGRSLSIARDAQIPAIYCEYLGAATCSAAGVDAYVEGCLNVLAELDMLQRMPPVDRVRHIVENPTPGSGHMQVCNPAPITGYFETRVNPGDFIAAGEPLGLVHSLDGTDSRSIVATHSGLVLVLRTFPRVLAGESVGVVLDL